ncbi:MAG: hypothetical protein HC831_02165 [Chloroflexia bacterium]|nr:hypothetical protein [Chloroflexia bacterium]
MEIEIDPDFVSFNQDDSINIVLFNKGNYSIISQTENSVAGISGNIVTLDSALPPEYVIDSSSQIYVQNESYRKTSNITNNLVNGTLSVDISNYIFQKNQMMSLIIEEDASYGKAARFNGSTYLELPPNNSYPTTKWGLKFRFNTGNYTSIPGNAAAMVFSIGGDFAAGEGIHCQFYQPFGWLRIFFNNFGDANLYSPPGIFTSHNTEYDVEILYKDQFNVKWIVNGITYNLNGNFAGGVNWNSNNTYIGNGSNNGTPYYPGQIFNGDIHKFEFFSIDSSFNKISDFINLNFSEGNFIAVPNYVSPDAIWYGGPANYIQTEEIISGGHSWGSAFRVLDSSASGYHLVEGNLPQFVIDASDRYTIKAKHSFSNYSTFQIDVSNATEVSNNFKIYHDDIYYHQYYLDNTFVYVNLLFDHDKINQQWYDSSDGLIESKYFYPYDTAIEVDVSTLVILRATYDPSSYMLNQKNLWTITDHKSKDVLMRVFNDSIFYIFDEEGTYDIKAEAYDSFGNLGYQNFEGLIKVI